jgi:F-box protein 21
MYLDPFRSSIEVKQFDLTRTLRDMGVPTSDQAAFLSDTNTREMVLRTARNIMNSVQTIRQTEQGRHNVQPTWFISHPDMDNAFYATIWAMLILTPGNETSIGVTNVRRRQYLPYLMEHFGTHCPWDVGMLEKHVIPMFAHQPDSERLMEYVRSTLELDSMHKLAISRDEQSVDVKFKVGQLFKHRRYSYEGVITGWDVNCDAGEEWIENTGVDSLPNGRNQAFYHVL